MTAEEVIKKIDVRAAVEAAIAREWWLIGGPDGRVHLTQREEVHDLGLGRGRIELSRCALATRLEALVLARPWRWLPPTSTDPLDYTGNDEASLTREIALLLDWAA